LGGGGDRMCEDGVETAASGRTWWTWAGAGAWRGWVGGDGDDVGRAIRSFVVRSPVRSFARPFVHSLHAAVGWMIGSD